MNLDVEFKNVNKINQPSSNNKSKVKVCPYCSL